MLREKGVVTLFRRFHFFFFLRTARAHYDLIYLDPPLKIFKPFSVALKRDVLNRAVLSSLHIQKLGRSLLERHSLLAYLISITLRHQHQ